MKNHYMALIMFSVVGVLYACQNPNDDNIVYVVKDYEEQNKIVLYEDYSSNDQFDDIAEKYALSEPYSVIADGQNVSIQAYSYQPSDSLNIVTFKYSDLINRAISYKQQYPDRQVYIDFAIYKMDKNVYIGFNPNGSGYGKVAGNDHSGENSEKLVLSLIKAAKIKIHTRVIYHNPSDDRDIRQYFDVYMDDMCFGAETEKVSDYFSYKKVFWTEGSGFGQMHNKFLLINHESKDGSTLRKQVYISTANVDPHNNSGIPEGREWVQSGILISGNSGLHDSYTNYFEKIWDNNIDRSSFWSDVRSGGLYNHQNTNLNYQDEVFSAYFFPIPSNASQSSWDILNNPVAKIINNMKDRVHEKEININMYHLKSDEFGLRLYNELKRIDNITVKSAIHRDSHNLSQTLFNDLGDLTWNAPTHAKNYSIKERLPDGNVYYTISGSTNGKWDAYYSKGNNQLLIQETADSYIHDVFVDIFNSAFTNN